MVLPEDTELTGTKNSKYRIKRVLGQGGFGIVYEASNAQSERVAVKEYFPSALATRAGNSKQVNINTVAPEAKELFDSQKKRFLQEAAHMKQFDDDPHIVDVFDCFEENGTAYIVMEFIEGNNLAQVLAQVPNNRLPLTNVISDLEPIVEILEKIHSVNLIHRDISPYNIMFSAKVTKLMDFGVIRFISLHHEFENYLSPEQFQEIGAEELQGAWTDVYALAATIYHAITGKLPPNAAQRYYQFYHNNKDILKRPSTFGTKITPQQEAALLKGMALKIQDRYQTVREFFNALKGTPPPPPPPPPMTIDKRAWIAAGCAILMAFASFGYTNATQTQLTKVNDEIKELKTSTSKYDYISNNFGYGSSAYYADTPVLVLDKDGDSGNIPVYWSNWGKEQTTERDADISNPEGLKVIWSDEVKNQRRNAVVTPDSESGAYVVHFSNKKDNDAFDVLVVVK